MILTHNHLHIGGKSAPKFLFLNMILEELIYFERQHLKAADPLDLQLAQIYRFFSGFPPLSMEKLKFFVVLLKERQAEEKSYEGLMPFKLTFIFLLFMLICSFLALKGLSLFTEMKKELLLASMVLSFLWIMMLIQLICSRKRLKYHLLIRVLESHIAKTSADYPRSS